MFDDEFYIVSRKWFNQWKAYISFDYIAQTVKEEKKNEEELSLNKVMNSGALHPGPISNSHLILDFRDFYRDRNNEKCYTNFPIREDLVIDRDYILVSRGAWAYLKAKYGGLEVKRYSF